MAPNNNEEALLEAWEEVYKRGLLTFWLLLVLADRPAYAYEMSAALRELSNATIVVNEQSIYRALTRFEGAGLVSSSIQQSHTGPPRKYYHLTATGHNILGRFIRRNLQIFQHPSIIARFQALTVSRDSEETT